MPTQTRLNSGAAPVRIATLVAVFAVSLILLWLSLQNPEPPEPTIARADIGAASQGPSMDATPPAAETKDQVIGSLPYVEDTPGPVAHQASPQPSQGDLAETEAALPSIERTYRGIVVDQNQDRCPNASVSLYSPYSFRGTMGLSFPTSIVTTNTDSSGQFEIKWTGTGEPKHTLQAAKQGYVRGDYYSVDGSRLDLKLSLRKGSQLSARIALPDGAAHSACIDSLQYTFLDANYRAIYCVNTEQSFTVEGNTLTVKWGVVPPGAVALVVCHRALGAVFSAGDLVEHKSGARIRPSASYLRRRMTRQPRVWMDVRPDQAAPGVIAERLQLARSESEAVPVVELDLRRAFHVVTVDTHTDSGEPAQDVSARLFGDFGSLALEPKHQEPNHFVALAPAQEAKLELNSPHYSTRVLPIRRSHERIILQ